MESDAQQTSTSRHTPTQVFPIVGIGASAGGLEAVTQVLQHLPARTGMAFVLVQHLDPTHKSLLADPLTRATPMEVRVAQEGLVVEADHVYVIPPNTDMTLVQGILALVPQTKTQGQHFSIDTFLLSLAESQSARAIGIILSGAATDGTRGLQGIKAQGGLTLAQDVRSAKFSGMPQSAIAAGCVDFIGSPEQIAEELTRMSRHPYLHQPLVTQTDEEESASFVRVQALPEEERGFQQILRALGLRTGVDLTAYKSTTLKRRIQRRMALAQIDSFAGYLSYLSHHPAEGEALYQDILIGVTSFFRHASNFALLSREVFGRLVETKSAQSPIRVWVPGCSTGEEVYSLAICLLEFLAERSLTLPIQLFGTDLNAQAIEYARAGLYSPGAVGHLSPARLDQFFGRVNGHYQISTSIRDLCVFAQHNVLSDPPFSRLDLLSCQNVLIYLGAGAQKKILQTFHCALNPHGFLMLGPSETIRSATDLFGHVGVLSEPLYMQKTTSTRPLSAEVGRRSTRGGPPNPSEEGNTMAYEESVPELDLQKETDRLLASYAPASVVIDAEMEIQHFPRHQIRIEGGVGMPVYGDPEGIGQVLTNLLSNAIKYAPQAESILVKLQADADTATVGVQDFGIGIEQEKQAHVFDRFFRVSEQERKTFPGLGLGLYISAQIVERQGGRMWVESRQGAGTTFSFTIPFAPRPASGTVQEEGAEPHA